MPLQSGPILNGQFHCNPEIFPITGCLDDVITSLFWRQARGLIFGPKADMVPVHWGQTQAAWWRRLVLDEPGFEMTEDSCNFPYSELKAKV